MKHYIIGYGSLINLQSLQRTLPDVSSIFPIYLTNYARSWNAFENQSSTLSTTYLGINKDIGSKVNSIIFEIEENQLDYLDNREFLYNRELVNHNDIEFIVDSIKLNSNDKVWIYTTKSPSFPAKDHPLIQSYIDVCLSGCLEIEIKFKINNFAKDFISLTKEWSINWVNDRIYPRAPHIYQPYAYKIDQMLSTQLPEYYKEIIIE